MSISTGISAIAIVESGLASQQAAKAVYIACESSMQKFKHEGSTREQILSYTSCANALYIEPDTPQDIAGKKILAGGVLIAIVIAVLVSNFRAKSYTEWWETWIFIPIFYLLGATCILVLIAGIVAIIKFILS
jgi:hypothetical protein